MRRRGLQSPPMCIWKKQQQQCGATAGATLPSFWAAAGAGNMNTLFDGSSGKKAPLFSTASPPFSWMVILLRYIYVEVPTMCLLVWDERISGSLCVINSITRGILRVMVPNSFRDFYTLESLKTFYIFPILYWLLRNVLHIYLPQVLCRMRYYYVETKLQAKVAFTNYMNREFWKIVHIIGV